MPEMIEMTVDSVRVSLTNQQRIIVLKKKPPSVSCPFGSAPTKLKPSPWHCRSLKLPVRRPMT